MRKTYRSDGLGGFWQGYSLNLVRTIPQAAAPRPLVPAFTSHPLHLAPSRRPSADGSPPSPTHPARACLQCVITFVAYEWLSDLLQTQLLARGGQAASTSDARRPLEALVRRHSAGKPQGG